MQSRFWKFHADTLLAMVCFLLGAPAAAFTQDDNNSYTQGSYSRPKKSAYAYYRTWNLMPLSGGCMNLYKAVGERKKEPISGLLVPGQCPPYGSIEPSRFKLVSEPVQGYFGKILPDAEKKIKTSEVIFKADRYYTIVILPKKDSLGEDGEPTDYTVEIIDDSYDIQSDMRAALKVFNASPSFTFRIIVGGQEKVVPALATMLIPVEQNDASAVTLTQVVTEGKGQQYALPLDFSVSRRASLVIASDAYGLLNPKITYDGKALNAASSVEVELRELDTPQQ